MADLPCVAVAPISLAYSGSILTDGPVPDVAICQAATNTREQEQRNQTSTQTQPDLHGSPVAPYAARLMAKLLM